MKKRAVLLVVPLLLAVAGCGSTGPTASPIESETATSAPEPNRCLAVDQSTIDAITAGVDQEVSLSQWAAVRSEDYSQVWFVSAVAQNAGLEGDLFTFATNADPTQPAGSGMVLAADGFSDEFSEWPYGPDTEFGIQFVDDGGEESRTCAEAS